MGWIKRISLFSALVMVIVVGLSIVTWAVLQRGVDDQDRALLKDSEAQVVLLLQSTVQNLQTQLRSVGFFTTASQDSPQVFAQQVKPLLTSPAVSVALVDTSRSQPEVVLAAGADLHQGQALPAPVAGVADRASTALSSSLVRVGGKTLLVLTAAPSTNPQIVTVQTTALQPNRPTPNRTGPYSRVYINIYATPSADRRDLILTTYGSGPLPQPVASSVLRLGLVHWRVEAAQRTPLAGTYAHATPWVALGVGVLLALALASLVESQARRERHAARLVAERTEELLQAQKVLLRQERLAAVGELTTVVGHELRNPLGAVLNELYLLRYSLDVVPPDAEKRLLAIERQVNRAARLSEDLTTYMRERDPVPTDIEFAALVGEVLEATPPEPGIDVRVEDTARFWADHLLMTQVVTNALTNAYQAMPDGGSVRLSATQEDGTTRIAIEDSGSGIDPDAALQLFDPFFTTRSEGTGLGLAIVRRLVELHGGIVSIENVSSGGARLEIRLPSRPAP